MLGIATYFFDLSRSLLRSSSRLTLGADFGWLSFAVITASVLDFVASLESDPGGEGLAIFFEQDDATTSRKTVSAVGVQAPGTSLRISHSRRGTGEMRRDAGWIDDITFAVLWRQVEPPPS
jgi:hypothetical protein